MKTTSLVLAALSTSLVAASPAGRDIKLLAEQHPHAKRQSKFGAVAGLPDGLAAMIPMVANSGALPWVVKSILNGGYGKTGYSKGSVTELTNRNPQIPGAKTVKIKYGPYTVPSTARKNMLGESGTLFNYPDGEVKKPCEGACTILGMKADLEYTDGSPAIIANGMWLHHVRLLLSQRFDWHVLTSHRWSYSTSVPAEWTLHVSHSHTRPHYDLLTSIKVSARPPSLTSSSDPTPANPNASSPPVTSEEKSVSPHPTTPPKNSATS